MRRTLRSSWLRAPLRSSILTIVETRSQSFATALWHFRIRSRTSSREPSTTVPIGLSRYGRPLLSTMSRQRATCFETLTPLPTGEMLNSAIVIEGLGTLISRVVLARFVSVDYSRLADDYDAVRGDERVDREYWLRALVEVGRLRPGECILDVGAGTGRFAKLVAEFAKVTALDISREMLEKARAKGSFDLVLSDAHRLPFRRDAFDAALLVMVLHQLEDYPRALREVARVSRRAVVATSDLRNRRLGILEEAFPSLLGIDRDRFPAVEDLLASLSAAGFPNVDLESRPYRRVLTVPQELDRVRRKYISTLDLLPPGEFEKGVAFLEHELPKRHPSGFEVTAAFTFVVASR